jgi:cytochrome c oxidase subunit 2
MNLKISLTMGISWLILIVVLSGCSWIDRFNSSQGTSWGYGVFTSNGERIYFTSTSENGTELSYTSGPSSTGWMMMGGRLACASCHGPDGRGGVHSMGMMEVMEAPDIRWLTLQDEFSDDSFRLAVEEGQDPDGSIMSMDMPRWKMSDQDLSDLLSFLKSLP